MDPLSQGIVVAIIAALFMALVAVGIVVLILVYQKKQVGFKQEKEQQILTSQLEAQEQTFREIAQEIHDNIGQALTLVKLNISTIDFTKELQAREKLAHSKTLLTTALEDLRDLARSLSTDFVHAQGLEGAIQQLLHQLQRTGHYVTQFSAEGTAYPLTTAQELVLFRIVQELLHNVVKHVEASAVTVCVHFKENRLVIQVHDNGKGFDPDASPPTGTLGLGLHHMHNRARLLNGTLSFESKPGQGTTATIELVR